MTIRPETAHVCLRPEAFFSAFAAHGLASNTQIAEALDISPSTAWRIRLGETCPSSELIAKVLLFFDGNYSFDDLFTVGATRPTRRTVAAAGAQS